MTTYTTVGQPLSIGQVERAFKAHHIVLVNAGCGRMAINAALPPRYSDVPGIACQLVGSTGFPRIHVVKGQIVAFYYLSVYVAGSTRLLDDLLSHEASRSALLPEGSGSFDRAANVVVAIGGATHVPLPAISERRVQAATAALKKIGS